jgi:sigma-B regulation protein RsbU (phosphoserine phosphatase)
MSHHDYDQGTAFERWTRLLGLYVLAPLLLVLTIPVALHISLNPDFGLTVRHMVVVSVSEGGPAADAGILVGDRVLSVDSQTINTMVDYYVAVAGKYNSTARNYVVRRNGEMLTFAVKPVPPSRSRMVWGYSLWIPGFAFLLMGWWVLSKRNDVVARDFFTLSMIFAFFLADIPDLPSRTYMICKEIVRDFLQLLWPAYFLRFLIHFPSTGSLTARLKYRARLLLIPVVPLFLLSLYAQLKQLDPATSPIIMLVQNGAFIYFLIYFVTGLVIFARKVLRRDRPIMHTKMRVVLFGLLGGVTPFLLGSFLAIFFPDSKILHWEWLGFSLLLVPLSIGLAILRYGALDTQFVIRSSLTYGALTLILLMVYFLVVVVMGHFLTSYFQESAYPLAILAVAGCALILMPARRKVQGWIDDTFYPARRANREAIEELGHQLSRLLDSQDAAQILLASLANLYRPQRLSLFTSEPEDPSSLREVASTNNGNPVKPVFTLARDTALAHYLNEVRRPVFSEEFEEHRRRTADTSDSLSFLRRLDCQLLVPLVSGNQLSGFLAFGPKSSGELYSQDDLSNLRFLTIQAAALLENRRLYQESLARKRLETELSVAQEIQAHLLPTDPLILPGLQICGRMDSCREVGGDYFDYFPYDSQSVGIAIADVAGKGIPAALLMTSLRVTFRSEAARSSFPEQVVNQLNRAVEGMVTSGQFISFFYGIYNLADRCLRYCNAGMNPPLLFHARRDYFETLKKGGPVLGVAPGHRFRAGTIRLEEGDLLVLYTDGVTEEVNTEGDFFDLDRLIATVRVNIHSHIEQLRETIFSTVSDFGGQEQSDDRTVILFKTNPF